MRAQSNWLTASAAAVLLFGTSNATLPDELRDRKLSKCVSDTEFNKIEDKGSFWYDSGAEQFADDYINAQNDHSQWAQRLFRDILPDENHYGFDCTTPEALCDFDTSCEKFNAVDKGGLYYLFVSMRNYHNYMKALKSDMNDNFLRNAVSVSKIMEILNLPDGEQDDSPNIIAILSGAAGIASSVAGISTAGFATPLAGSVGALSGVFSVLGNVDASSVVPDQRGPAKAKIDTMIDNTIGKTNTIISDIVGGVFGRQGYSQDNIPDPMRRGGVDNPAVQVFGWGTWLRDDSNTAAAEKFADKFHDKANQSLLWQMGRLFKKMFVVIRTDLPEDKCTNPNNSWDDDKEHCMDLLSWDGGDHSTLGGANDLTANDMWKVWGMDKFWTMRNAVECWEEHDGHIGDAEPTQIWEGSTPPPCFFAMEVVKGSYSDSHKGMIKLGGDFAGQHGLDDKMWPKSKCEDASEFERGAYACEYTWVGDE